MNTESDLRAVLTDDARDISEPDDVLARVQLTAHRPATKRRWLAPAATAAAVVAAVVVAGTLVATDRSGHGTAPATLPGLPSQGLWITPYVHPVAGYDVTTVELDNSAVGVDVLYPGRRDVPAAGDVTAYAPGIWDPALAKGAERVTVHGRTGYYGRMSQGGYNRPTLAWPSAAGGWIVIRGWDDATAKARHLDPRTEELRIAEAVDENASEQLHLPVRIGYLPAGVRFASVSAHLTKPAGDTHIVFSPTGVTHYDRTGTLSDEALPPGNLSIILSPSSQPGQPTVHNTKVDGHDANVEMSDGQRNLTVYVRAGTLTLQGAYSKAELVKIFRSITLAPDIDDPATWFDTTR